MPPGRRIAEWLDVRPGEVRLVLLSFVGSFLVLSFLVLGRSLREAFYLDRFPVETLPYITVAVAAVTLPAVGRFTSLLSGGDPRRVLARLCLGLAAGLLLVWPLLGESSVGVVIFYLWTAAGTLLLGSGFWVATSEHFPLRGAKRLFGLISAGGTLGAVITGNSVGWLTPLVDPIWLVGLLVLLLLGLFAVQAALPAAEGSAKEAPGPEPRRSVRASLREGLGATWREPHLRTLALIVLVATVASTLVDYQFKEQVQAGMPGREGLASFFGAFYGWTGGAALLIQLLATARLLAVAGVGGSLAVLPLLLVGGSLWYLLAPGLVAATLLRGIDNSLRRSLHRSVLEFLYVPLPASLRRRSKPVIDSTVDSLAESLGAAVIFLWVTLPGLPSRYLSVFVVLLCGAFLLLARQMGRRYFDTLERRLTRSGAEEDAAPLRHGTGDRDLLAATLTDLRVMRTTRPRITRSEPAVALTPRRDEKPPEPEELSSLLQTGGGERLVELLERPEAWEAGHVPDLTRLLARDSLTERAAEILVSLGEAAVPHLAQRLRDAETDFVIRRRIPRVLARVGGEQADAALVDALSASRFEVRYRAALALARRRREGLAQASVDRRAPVWDAVRAEVRRERPVWELQRLLDGTEPGEDELVVRRAGVRGELSLEHTFRLLSLVLDPEAVRSAYYGVLRGTPELRSVALEYLEQVLPPDVRHRLWPFIGDVSDYRRERQQRPLEAVVSDLIRTGATLFAAEADRQALLRVLDARGRKEGEAGGAEA